jgi:hypothetical protein
VAEYTGSRRAIEPTSAAQARRMFAEDDTALTCPKCRAAVREGQEWCTLCLHVLHAPQPMAGTPETVPEVDQPGEPDSRGVASDVDVEAAAEVMLAQLAIDSDRAGFSVPPFLNSKARITAFAAAAMVGLSVAGLVTMAVLGRLFG